jgi:hypothetical protein
MRTHHNFTFYVQCLSVSAGKQRLLFAPTDVHKTNCNIQQLSVQMVIANLSYKFLLKWLKSGY